MLIVKYLFLDLLGEYEVKKICKEAGDVDCKNVEACDIEGCFCLSGFQRDFNNKCSKGLIIIILSSLIYFKLTECPLGYFGPDCGHAISTEAKCFNNQVEKHTENCKSCQPGFRLPRCTEGILNKTYSISTIYLILFQNFENLVADLK